MKILSLSLYNVKSIIHTSQVCTPFRMYYSWTQPPKWLINWKIKWFEIIKGKIKLIKIKSHETVTVVYQHILGILLNGNEIEKNEKMKKIEIDKSDVIVNVVPQLISFFEEEHQFDWEYWRFEKEMLIVKNDRLK